MGLHGLLQGLLCIFLCFSKWTTIIAIIRINFQDPGREVKESGEVVSDNVFGGGGGEKLYLWFWRLPGSPLPMLTSTFLPNLSRLNVNIKCSLLKVPPMLMPRFRLNTVKTLLDFCPLVITFVTSYRFTLIWSCLYHKDFPRLGWSEYLASRGRRLKGTHCLGHNWATLSRGDLNTETWGLDARLTTSFCKRFFFQSPKKWKPDQMWQNFLRKTSAKKGLFCRWWWWWWWCAGRMCWHYVGTSRATNYLSPSLAVSYCASYFEGYVYPGTQNGRIYCNECEWACFSVHRIHC
jgi:hypothetical protein